MGFISWIVLGLIAGAIAKAIKPGEQGGGWLATLLLGVVGAIARRLDWFGIVQCGCQCVLVAVDMVAGYRRVVDRPGYLGIVHAQEGIVNAFEGGSNLSRAGPPFAPGGCPSTGPVA